MSTKAEIQEKINKIGREKFLRVQDMLHVKSHAQEHLEAFRKRRREMEDILAESNDRLLAIPVEHEDIHAAYKAHVNTFWVPEEIDLSQDTEDWKLLTENEKHFIKTVLAFFAASDGIVNENLCSRFAQEVQYFEARSFYHFQMAMEDIHSETYGLLIDVLIKDPAEKTNALRAIETIPCVKKKADWAFDWIKDEKSNFATRLLAFAIVEGIFFSGSFCAIFWLKKRGLLPGLAYSNELISRDEGLHTDFAVLLYTKYIEDKLDVDTVHTIFKQAVDIEREFICESLPVSLIGMNSDLMSQYVEHVADVLLVDLGYPKLYNSPQPFDWMELLNLEGKTNFFERRVSEYNKSSVGKTQADQAFSLEAEF